MSQRLHVEYNGRAFKFDVVVNTDEDPKLITERLRTAAGGKKSNACVIMASSFDRSDLKTLFNLANKGIV